MYCIFSSIRRYFDCCRCCINRESDAMVNNNNSNNSNNNNNNNNNNTNNNDNCGGERSPFTFDDLTAFTPGGSNSSSAWSLTSSSSDEYDHTRQLLTHRIKSRDQLRFHGFGIDAAAPS